MSKPTPGRLNDHVYRVLSGQGEHADNLKFINGVWKFKAIGYDRSGAVIPDWGIWPSAAVRPSSRSTKS